MSNSSSTYTVLSHWLGTTQEAGKGVACCELTLDPEMQEQVQGLSISHTPRGRLY